MKETKIAMLAVFFVLSAGLIHSSELRELGRGHHSGSDDYNWFCPWCVQGYGEENPDALSNGYQDYKRLYNQEFRGGHSNLKGRITLDDALYLMDDYVTAMGIPGLRVGEVSDEGEDFRAEILSRDGSIFKILAISKQTGEIMPGE